LNFPIDDDNDLTWVKDKKKEALGQKIIILGRVFNDHYQPVKKARVEIWQACHSGRYNHQYDPNKAAIDPNFQGWGWTTTNEKGCYAFKTIKPAGYPVTYDWKRPPHIHFKITESHQKEFITQLYFSEEQELNKRDKILQRIPKDKQSLVMTKLVDNNSLDIKFGKFDIIL
ncbi:MAG: protocatechuate 3,4-dioxygenase, partial [Crocosphaera sp.]